MSSNRLIYDSCAYQKELQQSTDPLDYALYTGKYENSAKCRIELGSVGGNGVSLFNGNLVDLESDLRGQTREASLCPSKHYQPECDSCEGNTNGIPCDLVEITGFLNANDSSGTNGDNSHCDGRIKNSLSSYAEMTSSRGGFFITSIFFDKLNFIINSSIIFSNPKSTPIITR